MQAASPVKESAVSYQKQSVQGACAWHQDVSKQLTDLQEKPKSLVISHESFGRNTWAQLRQVLIRCAS